MGMGVEMRLTFENRATSGRETLDTAICAITSAEVDGAVVVYTSTGAVGGLTAYRLTSAEPLRLHDRAEYASDRIGRPTEDIAVVPGPGGPVLLFGGSDGALTARALRSDGRFADPPPDLDLPAGPRTIDRLDFRAEEMGGGVLALGGAEALRLYRVDAAGALSDLGAVTGPAAGAAAGVALGPGPDGATVAALSDGELVGARLTDAGALEPVDATGPGDGLAIAAPTAVEMVAAHGGHFALVAAAGSQSLSVVEVAADGSTAVRDHLIDTRTTRFGGVQDVAAAEIGGQVFVAAGGADDGVSLFTLLPGGRLVHLDSLASATGARLDDVTGLHMAAADGALHVFAATEDAGGLAHLRATMGAPGVVRRGDGTLDGGPGRDLLVAEGGDGTLRGGAGDDILVAGPAGGRLTGGAGADLFVLPGGGATVRITDFEPGTDRLDLSGFRMLRNPGQLEGAETDTGARLTFRDDVVRIDSADGGPIAPESLFGPAFPWPDRIALVQRAPDPAPAPDPDDVMPGAGPDGARVFRIGSEAPEPWFAGARVTVRPDDGAAFVVDADAEGRIDLSAAAGTRGHIEIARPIASGDPQLGVGDALDVLRLAVGLEPSFGPARPADRLAADFDRDGDIGVDDALDVLRVAVGLETETPPQWVILDPEAPAPDGLSAGLPFTVSETGSWELSAAAILTGDLGAGL
jgi:hypothetical protein